MESNHKPYTNDSHLPIAMKNDVKQISNSRIPSATHTVVNNQSMNQAKFIGLKKKPIIMEFSNKSQSNFRSENVTEQNSIRQENPKPITIEPILPSREEEDKFSHKTISKSTLRKKSPVVKQKKVVKLDPNLFCINDDLSELLEVM